MTKNNTGLKNTGEYNSGNENSGYSNSGNSNSGDWNSGYRNSGDSNSGNLNSGNWNSGNWNSGDNNSGDNNSGNCNTNSPNVRIFNKDSGWEFNSVKHINFRRILYKYSTPLCKFISENNMTEEEKEQNPTYKTTGGYLKTNTDLRNDKELLKEDKEFLRSVPNFDADILLETTGIDINGCKKKIIIDGKEVLISKESFEELKKQLTE